jgi:hypothetical protein
MNIISPNPSNTVAIVTDLNGFRNIGEFEPEYLKEWMGKVFEVLGTEDPIAIHIKQSENPLTPAWVIAASHEGMDPKVAVVGTWPADGKGWE